MSETSSHDSPAMEGDDGVVADDPRSTIGDLEEEELWPHASPDLQVLLNCELDYSMEDAVEALKLHGSAYQVVRADILKKLTGEVTAPSGESTASPCIDKC